MARTATKRRKPVRGRFITFEGGEGSGKSTQIRTLAERLEAGGVATLVTREPGGTPGAEVLRHVVLSGMGKLIGAELESLLFAAARDDHVHRVIAPALAAGTWVLCDRFADSTRVYQGILGDVDPRLLDALERVTIGDLKPDLTLVLDLPVEIGLGRAAARRGAGEADRFEAEGAAFHERLRAAYLQIARDNPTRCVVIDATGTAEEVAERIWDVVRQRLVPPARAARRKARAKA
jgi:dTMP kinase